MKIQVRAIHFEVTDALQQYVNSKIGRLEKYFHAPSTHSVSVTLSVVKDVHGVEVTMPLDGFVIRAEEKSTDMYASIDLVAEKLEKQILKHKNKLNKRLRQKGIHSLFVETGGARHLDEQEDQVVRVKKFPVKPMQLDEAIMQMDLLGHDFFVFRDADSEKVHVVYKRNDGHYGLIEPAFA